MSTFMMATYRNNNSTMPASHHHHHTTIDSSSASESAAAAAAAAAAAKGKKPYKSWLKDGVNTGQSSMEILVRWLSDKNNYAKWRGDYHDASDPTSTTITTPSNLHVDITNHHEQHHRTPKKVLLEEIVNEMRKAGIYHRYPKDVASKISTLQSNYRAARDWYEAEGKRLMQQGAVRSAIHEEIQKRFPYWDALHDSFGSSSSSTNIRSPAPSISSPPSSSPDPMSLSSIIDHQQQHCQEDEDEDDQLAQDDDDDGDSDNDDQNSNTNSSSNHDDDNDDGDDDDDDDDDYIDREEQVSSRKRRQDQSGDDKDTAQVNKNVLGNSLIQVTREKEAGRMRRSRDILEFLRKKRMNREQYLIEKERTRRIRAKADLVRNLTEAGFSKQEISEQLSML